MKYEFKDDKYKSMIYACYFIDNSKKKSCTYKELFNWIHSKDRKKDEGVTPRHKYKYVGSYDINIDGIGGDYWECTECGNIKFDEPDNI
jgi:hypothetical protein|tara:strand:+ start:40 stop:306 length:267 start_codon:yes stop_codon:yes gene_type:complete